MRHLSLFASQRPVHRVTVLSAQLPHPHRGTVSKDHADPRNLLHALVVQHRLRPLCCHTGTCFPDQLLYTPTFHAPISARSNKSLVLLCWHRLQPLLTTPADPPDTVATEQHYTPQEVAEMLKVTPQTVCRMFRDVAGVIEFGSDENAFKRKRKFIRIPKSVFVRWHESNRCVR